MAKSKEELKSLLMKVKEESEKAGSKLNFQKTKIMVSGLVTSWQINGKNGNSDSFILLGSKVTVDVDCSNKINRPPLLVRNYDQPKQHIKKQRHRFSDKSPYSQRYGFPSSHALM